jgi:crotonobetainyl-CoA:carnitine CoA-transferase CaiB-like acyl-CoA transferase
MTPNLYARELLSEVGFDPSLCTSNDDRSAAELWAASGAQYLTGEVDGPALPCPAPLASCAQGAWLALSALTHGALDPQFAAYQLLGERAALLGLRRLGSIAPGGACRLLDCADGQLALNLSRDEDWTLLPAWLEHEADNWQAIAHALRTRQAQPLVERARLLGLAAATSQPPAIRSNWFSANRLCAAVPRPQRQPLVLDLTALWAGPLCTQLLGHVGARVIKVESYSRPDGARNGPRAFFNVLNTNKQSVALDLACAEGRQQLRGLLRKADIVIESARPRALEHMGIRAAEIVRGSAGRVWLSITGYGRDEPMREWIAYGDDAGVAAGLSWMLRAAHGRNLFCADAIADPLTGLHAALLAHAAWTQGGGVLLDVSLHGVVQRCIASGDAHGSSGRTARELPVRQPCARDAPHSAPPLGTHTAQILSEFGLVTT